MMEYILQMSPAQLRLIRDMLVEIGEKKMMYVPTESGERVAVPLPTEAIDQILLKMDVSDRESQLIHYTSVEKEGGRTQVRLAWGTHSLEYTVEDDEYALQ
jgi:hypothetical protein